MDRKKEERGREREKEANRWIERKRIEREREPPQKRGRRSLLFSKRPH